MDSFRTRCHDQLGTERIAIVLLLTGLFLACPLTGCRRSAGPAIPAIVEGDSMAPQLCGSHRLATCDECQFEFRAENSGRLDQPMTCPNCGFAEVDSSSAKQIEPAAIELIPYGTSPRRWDVVGLNLPEEAENEMGIKRIVGLPGDTIEIRSGDLFLRDEVLRKGWKLQKQMRISVFDSQHNAIIPFDNRSRFKVADASGWKVRESELRFANVGERVDADQVDWIQYVQWRNCQRKGKRDDPFPIEDNYAFNQRTTRELNCVDDLFLELDAEFEIGGTLVIAFRRNKAEFVFRIRKTETEFRTEWSGSTARRPIVLTQILKSELPGGRIEFSSFDRTLRLKINGESIFELREDETVEEVARDSVFEPESQVPFQVGGSSGMFKILRFRIWRDVYYLTAPASFAAPENLKLSAGPNEYIVLGDNSPKSLDSRIWKKPAIGRSDILGKRAIDPAQR